MTNVAPGILWNYFLEAIVLTAPISIILLYWYRRAVARSMGTVSVVQTESGEVDQGGRWTAKELSNSTELHEQDHADEDVAARGLRRRLMVIYVVAGMAAAAVMTGLYLRSLEVEFNAFRAWMIWYAFCWPTVPTLAALLVIPQRKALLGFAGFVCVGIAVTLLWSMFSLTVLGRSYVSPWGNAQNFLMFLLMQAWLPYLLILITGNRKLRSVSPLVLAGLLVFSFSALALRNAFVVVLDYPAIRETLLHLGTSSYYLWFMIAALPVGFACWQGLRWIGKHFGQKAFSDVQVLVDTWWLIVAFDYTVSISNYFGWSGLVGLLAFVAYRLVVALGLVLSRVSILPDKRRRLLLLRVFGFQRRTEKLFDVIAQRWRFVGTLRMIAGADLAMRTIDPGDFISFLGGRLRQLFVQNNRDLSQRLAWLDEARDPDGRFRVNEFFCHDNTWRPTLKALLTRSDLVLMDLRAFSESNCGCLFELEQLVENGLLQRTVFVIDHKTDVPLLESTLMQHARRIDALGKDASLPRLNLSHSETQSTTDLDRIYGSLHALA